MYYKELWNIVKKNKGMFGEVTVIVIILSILPLLQSLMVQKLTGRLQGWGNNSIFGIVLIYAVLMFVLPPVFRQIQSYLNTILDYVVKTHMVQFVYGKACKVPIKYFENSGQASLLHRALDVNSHDSQTMILALVDIGVQIITLAILTIRFGWLGLGLLIISFFLTLLDEGVEYRIREMDYSFRKEREETERFCRMLRRLLVNKKSVAELFAYDARQVYVEKLCQQHKKLDDGIRKYHMKRFWYVLLVSIIYVMRDGLLYLLIVLSACYSFISVPVAVGVFTIVGSYGGACSSLIQNFTNLRVQKFFCREFEEMLALPEEKADSTKEELQIQDAEVIFEDVHYQYPNNTTEALANISFCIQPGEKIALVGDNGAGKSTLIRLLLGLDEPVMGEAYLKFKGSERKYGIHVIRKYATIMLQNFCKYPYTVRENIVIGDMGGEDKEGQIMDKVIEELELQKMVAQMPNQLETEIISDGILSGGEWQMVALSRAYMKKGCFIILDEPTAAIDAKREIWLYRKFLKLIKDHTAIIVSHRLPICQICDRIFVMQSGKIIESGTHEELMNQRGHYAEMYEQQAEMYQ